MRNFAYITVLTNTKYIPGVRALARSLKEVKSKYPLYLLIPEDGEDILFGFSENDREIFGKDRIIRQPNVKVPSEMENSDSYWKYTFFKLQSMRCTQFDKIILLDSDMLIQNNIDELFSSSHYSAAVAGKTRMNQWEMFNSGLMVMEPSNKFADKLVKLIPQTVEKRKKEGLSSGDQDVFQEAFPKWKYNKELCLDEIYNCFFLDIDYVCKAYDCKVEELFVIHFYGARKPWEYDRFETFKILKNKYMKNPFVAIKMTKVIKKYISYTKDRIN